MGQVFLLKNVKLPIRMPFDSFAADWLLTKAIAANKTPADIISEMVYKEMTA